MGHNFNDFVVTPSLLRISRAKEVECELENDAVFAESFHGTYEPRWQESHQCRGFQQGQTD